MRASGVYWNLTDQSIRVPGSSGLIGTVAMLTTKGKLNELNRVTADNIEDVVGYDLSYNADYLGLARMLEHVPYLYILRLNSGAAVANVYDTAAGALASVEGLSEDTSLEDLETTFSVQALSAGNNPNYYFKILPVASTQNLAVPAAEGGSFTIQFRSAIDKNKKPFFVSGVAYSLGIYNSARTQLLAVGSSDGKLYLVTDGAVTSTQAGTFTNEQLVITQSVLDLTTAAISVEAFEEATQLYNFYFATSSNGIDFTQKFVKPISLAASNEYFYENVDLVNFKLHVKNAAGFKYELVSTYTSLQNGDNGVMVGSGAINWAAFDRVTSNICVLMNISDISVVNAFLRHNETLYRTTLCSTPVMDEYAQVSTWASNLYHTEYRQLYWIHDIEETEVGNVYIAPSVNAFIIYAQMQAAYGTMNYPPAGYTYGNVSITKLVPTDYALFKDQLKTEAINYQMVGSRGPVMWEERTGYADTKSDLAYANTVFILRDLRERILDFALGYNFQYTSPTMLTTFNRGLRTIFQTLEDQGFLAKWEVKVPSFEEAQEAGRTLTVKCSVSVMQVAEEIVFDITLKSFADM